MKRRIYPNIATNTLFLIPTMGFVWCEEYLNLTFAFLIFRLAIRIYTKSYWDYDEGDEDE